MDKNAPGVGARQILRLEQMSESAKRKWVAQGLTKIAENIEDLLAEVERTGTQETRTSAILTQIAAEESGKGFILVDYMRPYDGITPDRRSRHLRGAYSHLARGIYVKYYDTSPSTFQETASIVDYYRLSHYLDGPNDVDWIFRNEVEDEREGELYVDLVANEEGLAWYSPLERWKTRREVYSPAVFQPRICRLFRLMHHAGLFGEGALDRMARAWKGVAITPSTHWTECEKVNVKFLSECKKRCSLVQEAGEDVLKEIAWDFLYPLCGLDLTERRVTQDELLETRQHHLHSQEPEY